MENLNLDNMKCCGNCHHFDRSDMVKYNEIKCTKKNVIKSGWAYCNDWKFDELSWDIRKELT